MGPGRTRSSSFADLHHDPDDIPGIELRGLPGVFRARFHHGMYRMIFRISRNQRKILIERIRLREAAYKGMKSPGRE